MTNNFPTKSGGNLMKRELILDASRYDEFTGEKRENFPTFTFMQKNCEKLDGFSQGDLVEVSFILQGRKYNKDGQEKYINDIVGYRIEPYQRKAQPTQIEAQAPQAEVQTPMPTVSESKEEDDNVLPF